MRDHRLQAEQASRRFVKIEVSRCGKLASDHISEP